MFQEGVFVYVGLVELHLYLFEVLGHFHEVPFELLSGFLELMDAQDGFLLDSVVVLVNYPVGNLGLLELGLDLQELSLQCLNVPLGLQDLSHLSLQLHLQLLDSPDKFLYLHVLDPLDLDEAVVPFLQQASELPLVEGSLVLYPSHFIQERPLSILVLLDSVFQLLVLSLRIQHVLFPLLQQTRSRVKLPDQIGHVLLEFLLLQLVLQVLVRLLLQ